MTGGKPRGNASSRGSLGLSLDGWCLGLGLVIEVLSHHCYGLHSVTAGFFVSAIILHLFKSVHLRHFWSPNGNTGRRQPSLLAATPATLL